MKRSKKRLHVLNSMLVNRRKKLEERLTPSYVHGVPIAMSMPTALHMSKFPSNSDIVLHALGQVLCAPDFTDEQFRHIDSSPDLSPRMLRVGQVLTANAAHAASFLTES
eukprot:1159659-Pelagomonas_calceolata.AAC.7